MDKQQRSPYLSLLIALSSPFRVHGRIYRLIVALFLLINTIVAYNAIFHHPAIGYDGLDHLTYIAALAERRFPQPRETREFFSPPLPYYLPSVFYRSCMAQNLDARLRVPYVKPCLFLSGKIAQFQNLALSVVLTWTLLLICGLVRPNSARLKMLTLLLLALLPAYYRTFALVRGEALVAAWTVLVIYQILAMLDKRDYGVLRVICLGLSGGMLLLSRQWGALVLLGVVGWTGILLLRGRRSAWPFARAVAVAMLIAACSGGWFYALLRFQYGQATTFNRQPLTHFSLANQPRDFYFGTGIPQLWTAPVRPSFANQLMPMLVADTWGDYWGYFLVTGTNPRKGQDWANSNVEQIKPYLGSVVLTATVPALLLLGGSLRGLVTIRKKVAFDRHLNMADVALGLCGVVIACSVLGYLWFLISFPNPDKGDTIKATYIAHILVLAPLLGADLLERLRTWSLPLYRVIIVLTVGTLLVSLPATITRYPYFFWR